MDKPVKPFWATYQPVSRLGWTTLALIAMWPFAIVVFVACAISLIAILAFVAVGYPLAHFIWGMQSAGDGK